MSELAKQYNPHEHEERMYAAWEEGGVFKPNQGKPFERAQGKPPFVIMLPLPNITGSLHMGHALQHSIMDVLIRYHRMLGEPTLWQPGTDHAGIATQNVVEKQLRTEGLSRHDLGREKFLERVWQWREQYGNTIVQQMKRLGSSADWSRSVFTMDEAYVSAVHETFIRYHKRGYLYRGNRIVNWCPRCASVISDLEIKHEAHDATLYTLRYPLAAGDGHIDVATTRPETMLGDTAVAVNTTDERYRALVGQTVRLPLVEREVPIIADERIEKSFGTGAVKVTPAHDHLDAALAQTHRLEVINVIGEDGKLTSAAGAFAGQSVTEARTAVIAALQEAGALIAEEPYRHEIALCERCGTVIEPLLSRQWFVDMSKLKEETIQVAETELVQFFPARWREHFLEWMHGVHDWTISRQLWWGQSIPVWWKPGVRGTEKENEPGAFVVSVAKPAGDWEADPDVLDTWFSSAIWPLATLGWPEATEDLKRFYPTSVLATAREIVYLWVARMIFSGLELLKDDEYGKKTLEERIPFREVFIHPTVLTKSGQRMSKSLGTGIDPLQLIAEYGADATRFGLLYQMSYDNQAIRFDEQVIASARNFANKLWNVARLLESLPDRDEATLADDWIQERVAAVTQTVTEQIATYKLGEAARLLYDLVWHDFADWYVEILKVQGSTTIARQAFLDILKILHPFMPHLTEVLWQAQNEGFIATAPWPAPAKPTEPTAAAMQRFQDIVSTVRSARVLLSIKPGEEISVVISDLPLPEAAATLMRASITEQSAAAMKQFPLTTGGTVAIGGEAVTPEAVATAAKKLHKEQQQLESVLEKLQATIQKMQGKAAPEKVVEKEAEVERLQARISELAKSLELLQ